MTRAERTIAIERNRSALLRLVRFWLLLTRLFGGKQERVLPYRVNRWVADQIFKAEKVLFLLRVLAANTWQISAVEPAFDDTPLTIAEIRLRLLAVKKGLINLHNFSKAKSFVEKQPQASPMLICTPTFLIAKAVLLAHCRAPLSDTRNKFCSFQIALLQSGNAGACLSAKPAFSWRRELALRLRLNVRPALSTI